MFNGRSWVDTDSSTWINSGSNWHFTGNRSSIQCTYTLQLISNVAHLSAIYSSALLQSSCYSFPRSILSYLFFSYIATHSAGHESIIKQTIGDTSWILMLIIPASAWIIIDVAVSSANNPSSWCWCYTHRRFLSIEVIALHVRALWTIPSVSCWILILLSLLPFYSWIVSFYYWWVAALKLFIYYLLVLNSTTL